MKIREETLEKFKNIVEDYPDISPVEIRMKNFSQFKDNEIPNVRKRGISHTEFIEKLPEMFVSKKREGKELTKRDVEYVLGEKYRNALRRKK